MTNVKLTYDYTLNSIKVVEEGIKDINTKLGAILTLSGIFMNFGKDLPDYSFIIKSSISSYSCLSCSVFKIGAYILLIVVIVLSLGGLILTNAGQIVLPQQLLREEWNLCSEEEYLTDLIKYLEQETLLKLNDFRTQKAIKLQWAIRCLGSAVFLFGIDEFLAILLPVLDRIN